MFGEKIEIYQLLVFNTKKIMISERGLKHQWFIEQKVKKENNKIFGNVSLNISERSSKNTFGFFFVEQPFRLYLEVSSRNYPYNYFSKHFWIFPLKYIRELFSKYFLLLRPKSEGIYLKMPPAVSSGKLPEIIARIPPSVYSKTAPLESIPKEPPVNLLEVFSRFLPSFLRTSRNYTFFFSECPREFRPEFLRKVL